MINIKPNFIVIILSMLVFSCQNAENSTKSKELELRESQLRQKEDELISEKKEVLKRKEQEIELERQKLHQKDVRVLQEEDGAVGSSKRIMAVIQDPDGYTNVRNGMSINAKIIDRLNEGEQYEVFPSSDSNWWVVYTQSNVKGYVHKSRIRITN